MVFSVFGIPSVRIINVSRPWMTTVAGFASPNIGILRPNSFKRFLDAPDRKRSFSISGMFFTRLRESRRDFSLSVVTTIFFALFF